MKAERTIDGATKILTDGDTYVAVGRVNGGLRIGFGQNRGDGFHVVIRLTDEEAAAIATLLA